MLRPLVVSTLAVVLCAGEPATPSAASLAIADGATLLAHWEASLYGRVWHDPGLAWVRQRWGEAKAELLAGKGLDLNILLAALTDVRAELLEPIDGAPAFRVQASFGAQAQLVYGLLAAGHAAADPVPGADAAVRFPGDGPVLARHGERLVIAFGCPPVPWPITASTADGSVRLDYRRFIDQFATLLPPAEQAEMAALRRDLDAFLGTLTWDSWLVPEGIHEIVTYDGGAPGMLPVDRALLDRFPANALLVGGAGLDGAAWWRTTGSMCLDTIDALLHPAAKQGSAATLAEIDAMLRAVGIPGGVEQLTREVSGSIAVAVTPGVPFPSGTLAVPRSPSIDAVVAAAASQVGVAPPAEGASAILPIPELPVVVSLVRDQHYWLLTSDTALAAAWPSGRSGGFLASPTGQAVLAGAPADATCMGGLDTAAVLRWVIPFATMALSHANSLPPEGRQAMLAGLNRLTRECSPSVLWSGQVDGLWRAEARGPLGIGCMPALIAAIAIPNLMESRVTANEAAAAATLQAGIFPAEIQFQAGAYMDQDGDNIGEYGTLAELAGRQQTNRSAAGALTLLSGPLAQGTIVNGYTFRIYLPDGTGGACSSDDAPRAPDAAPSDDQERYWIAYAWPQSRDTGRRMFALGVDGQVRSLPWDGQEPAWDAALERGWGSAPTWPISTHDFRP